MNNVIQFKHVEPKTRIPLPPQIKESNRIAEEGNGIAAAVETLFEPTEPEAARPAEITVEGIQRAEEVAQEAIRKYGLSPIVDCVRAKSAPKPAGMKPPLYYQQLADLWQMHCKNPDGFTEEDYIASAAELEDGWDEEMRQAKAAAELRDALRLRDEGFVTAGYVGAVARIQDNTRAMLEAVGTPLQEALKGAVTVAGTNCRDSSAPILDKIPFGDFPDNICPLTTPKCARTAKDVTLVNCTLRKGTPVLIVGFRKPSDSWLSGCPYIQYTKNGKPSYAILQMEEILTLPDSSGYGRRRHRCVYPHKGTPATFKERYKRYRAAGKMMDRLHAEGWRILSRAFHASPSQLAKVEADSKRNAANMRRLVRIQLGEKPFQRIRSGNAPAKRRFFFLKLLIGKHYDPF